MPEPRPAPPLSKPIHFVQHHFLTVAEWPARTHIPLTWLERDAHVYGVSVDGDVVTIKAANGTAKYELHRQYATRVGVVADLIEGDAPETLAENVKRFEVG